MKDQYKLVKCYPGSPELGTIATKEDPYYRYNGACMVFCNMVEGHPEYWEKIIEKDYEVLSLKFNKSKSVPEEYATIQGNGRYAITTTMFYGKDYTGGSTLESCLISGWSIFSVKRLSDSEIFTIGDKIILDNWMQGRKYIQIDEIYYNEHNQLSFRTTISPGPKTFIFGLSDINYKIYKEPIFTTEDGVGKFENDMCYFVTPRMFDVGYGKVVLGAEFKCALARFHDKTNAETWIEENKPQYSKNDVIEFGKYVKDCYQILDSHIESKFDRFMSNKKK